LREKFLKLFQEEEKHLRRLREAYSLLKELGYELPLNDKAVEELLKTREGTMALDQIAYRFSKIQDSLGKLLRAVLYLLGENVENLSMIDVISTAEKLGFPVSEEKWFELRGLRNVIAHEYEDETGKIAELVNRVYGELPYLQELLEYVSRRVR